VFQESWGLLPVTAAAPWLSICVGEEAEDESPDEELSGEPVDSEELLAAEYLVKKWKPAYQKKTVWYEAAYMYARNKELEAGLQDCEKAQECTRGHTRKKPRGVGLYHTELRGQKMRPHNGAKT